VGRSCGRAAVACLVVLLLVACGSSSPPTSDAAPTSQGTTTTAATTRATTEATDPPDPRLADAGAAGQAVVVTAPRYGATEGTLSAYERAGGGWRRVFGPWPAYVGTRGIAPPGDKREGDGRTPSGVYGFDFFFGVEPDPGVKFPYRRVTSRSIVWDDDPASPLYNTWVDLDRQQAGTTPEPMYNPPAYNHGAVIAYNTARTPPLGSAIFLHVSTGGPTAGCVSLPEPQLVEVLRWLDPARDPRIVLGVSG
jgi:L,D-peptidoglycan transpeptidase YkuD (ErfK/YbiS/YcfS/YnhG family)